MHYWGDEDFDWEQLDEAIKMVASFMHFWGRIGVQSKEKFGTARIYVTFWDGTFNGIIYPGYHFNQFPKWFWPIDYKISSFMRWIRLKKLVNRYQSKIYGMAYSKAIRAYPKVKIELVISADFEPLIKERQTIVRMYRFRRIIERLLRPVEYDNE
jgi:hypothetical protein